MSIFSPFSKVLVLAMLLASGCVERPPAGATPSSEPFAIDVSHSSLRFLPTQGNWSVRWSHLDGTELGNASTSGNLTIPFLEPRTAYRLNIAEANGTQYERQVSTTANEGWPLEDQLQIRPGAYIVVKGNASVLSCTASFILRDATNETLYLLTAGHCGPPGSRVYVSEAAGQSQTYVGQFSWFGEQDGSSKLDYALVRLEPGIRAGPGVRQWGGPTHETDSQQDLDEVCYFGHGADQLMLKQYQGRRGFRMAVEDTEDYMLVAGLAYQGDSGSPVVDCATGAPLGMLLAGFQVHWRGLKIARILEDLRASGLELRIATAPLAPI